MSCRIKDTDFAGIFVIIFVNKSFKNALLIFVEGSLFKKLTGIIRLNRQYCSNFLMVVFYDFYRSIFGSLFQINHLIQMFLLLSLTLFWLQVDFCVRLLCPQ